MLEIRECLDDLGHSSFGRWLAGLDNSAATRVAIALGRMEEGNLSNVRSVGQGVLEFRINFGPGYRIYFGRDGAALIILLGGGTKSRQGSATFGIPTPCGRTTDGRFGGPTDS